jgi:hypothetical protein
MLERFDSLASGAPNRAARFLWVIAIGALAVGLGAWAYGLVSGSIEAGVIALWSFTTAAVALAVVLPLAAALVSPLFMGIAGWLVDMLPFVILAGWAAVAVRWCVGLVRERRLPRGGRWIWLPIFILVWTGLGIIVITSLDFKHFLLLVGIQFVSTVTILAVVDCLKTLEGREALMSGLVSFVIVLSVAVLLQWVGVPIEPLQDGSVRKRVEAAYGVDAFPNNIGMIKYARSIKPGDAELQTKLKSLRGDNPDIPRFQVFRPKFAAYKNSLVIRFQGSARGQAAELSAAGVDLLYDNVGLAPANTVPRLRSFPRNALTYAGVCAALLPFAFYLAWAAAGRRRLIGQVGIAACLFGAAFSLARGAWVAIALGAIYLVVDGLVSKQMKMRFVLALVAAAVVLTGVFFVKYDVDPLSGRAGGGASVSTRDDLYKDTLSILKVNPKYIALGYGTERPRTESGTVKDGARYVPRAGTHSTYLNYLFRTGLPGGLAIIGLYLLALLHARAASRDRTDEERIFATSATAAMVIAAAHAAILSLYVEPIYSLVISLVVGAAMAGAVQLDRPIWPWHKAEAQ